MTELSFHDMRDRIVEHFGHLTELAEKSGTHGVDFSEHLSEFAAPSMIAIVGDPDSGVRPLVNSLIGEVSELPADRDDEIDFYCIHHPTYKPKFAREGTGVVANYYTYPILKKLCFTEIKTQSFIGPLPEIPPLDKADGIILVIDALDPWAGRVWSYYEHYADSHQGRICILLNKLEQLDERDWSVLQKHLGEKLSQLSSNPIEITLNVGEESIEEVRSFLEGDTINCDKWEELKPLSAELEGSMEAIQDTLREKHYWLDRATAFSAELNNDLANLRVTLERKVRERVDGIGTVFSGKATEIIADVRLSFNNKAFLKSIFKRRASLEVFHKRLESMLTDTLHEELGNCYRVIKESILFHEKEFKLHHEGLASQLPKFDSEESKLKIPLVLKREEVRREIHGAMLQLDVKKMFKQELSDIDRNARRKIKFSLLGVILAGLFGFLNLHWVGLGVFVVSVFGAYSALRNRELAVAQFCDFLHEWLTGFGPRMKGPTETLGGDIIDHAINYYHDCFFPVLLLLKQREEELPGLLESSRLAFLNNRDILQVLSIH